MKGSGFGFGHAADEPEPEHAAGCCDRKLDEVGAYLDQVIGRYFIGREASFEDCIDGRHSTEQ